MFDPLLRVKSPQVANVSEFQRTCIYTVIPCSIDGKELSMMIGLLYKMADVCLEFLTRKLWRNNGNKISAEKFHFQEFC